MGSLGKVALKFAPGRRKTGSIRRSLESKVRGICPRLRVKLMRQKRGLEKSADYCLEMHVRNFPRPFGELPTFWS